MQEFLVCPMKANNVRLCPWADVHYSDLPPHQVGSREHLEFTLEANTQHTS